MKKGCRAVLLGHALLSLALASAFGCGGDDDGGNDSGGDAGGDAGGGDDDAGGGNDSAPACQGLECQQVECASGATTSLSGTVYTPSGTEVPAFTLPLYNAVVYVPNDEVEAFEDGAGCYRCDAPLSGDPVVDTTTDTAGRFVLEDVPVGTDIPLVIQVGKWRRQVTVDVVECEDTEVDAELTRLPRNQSEGDIPRIALTTGGADALECLMAKVGLDASEFTPETEGGRINFYAAFDGTDSYLPPMNGGADFTPATTLWDSLENLSTYDIVLLSCEGTENPTNKSLLARDALRDYADLGGRVFASHWHNFWIEFGSDPFPTAATFNHRDDLLAITSDIDTSYEKGEALAEWLMNVGGSTTFAKLDILDAQHTVDAVDAATRWIYLDDNTNGVPSVQYLSFNTPMEAEEEEQCGRLVLSDIHVAPPASGDDSAPGIQYPDGCDSTVLSPQEKALMFMLFDISSCIEPDVGVD